MKSIIIILASAFLLLSCKETVKETTEEISVKMDQMDQTVAEKTETVEAKVEVETEPKIEIKDNIYSEFYPGTNHIKFKGEQTSKGERTGKWMYFGEDGTELSMTNYNNGIKSGPTMVKYSNGNLHYTGAYTDDKPSGIWTTYSEVGEKISEKNFDEL